MRKPGFCGDVAEGAVVVVSVELAAVAFAGLQVRQRGPVYQQDIHPTVVVVVECGDAPAHGIHDVLLVETSAGEVKVDASGASDVGEGSNRPGFFLMQSCRASLRIRQSC